MDPVTNPFVPGAGSPPPELVGRDALIEQARIAFARVRLGRHAKSFLIVGLRGVGKTVLLERLRRMAIQDGYRTITLEAREDKPLARLIAPPLRELILNLNRLGAITQASRHAVRALAGFLRTIKLKYADAELSLDIDPEPGMADSGDLEADLPALFSALGSAAQDRGIPIALFVDEMQYLSELDMSALILSLHRVSQDQHPIMLVGAGLPQIVGLTGRSKSYAERLFDFPPLGALPAELAAIALSHPAQVYGVSFDDDALDEVFSVTQGYPYFLQEWGYHAWNIAGSSPITRNDVRAATTAALRRLDEGFFRVRFDRLTPRERGYLRAMAELGAGPHRSGAIADALGSRVQMIGPLRAGLIRKGMIYSPEHGDTAFTVPLFDAYMRRAIPAFTAAPAHSRSQTEDE